MRASDLVDLYIKNDLEPPIKIIKLAEGANYRFNNRDANKLTTILQKAIDNKKKESNV